MNSESSAKRTTIESNGDKSNDLGPSTLDSDSKEPRKYRGVFPAGRRFRAVMQLDGVRHNLGMHSTEIEAARAYDRFAREHYKKTNFPYPLKREPAGGSTTSAQKHHLQASAAIDSLSKELREQRGPFTSFQQNQDVQSSLGTYSWPGNVAASTPTSNIPSSYAEMQYPLHHSGYDNSYNHGHYLGEQYPPAGPYSGSQLSHDFSHRPHSQDWQRHQNWQEPPAQHPPFMFPQHRNNSHPMSPHTTHPSMTYASHPVVYVPVPLPISEAVTKYVNDFHRYEQQQHSDPSSHLTPPVPHREPIFLQQPSPFTSVAVSAGAPELSSTLNGEPVPASGPSAPLLFGAAAHLLNHSPGGACNEENGTVAVAERASLKRAREDFSEAPTLNGVNGVTGVARDSPEGQEVASASRQEEEEQEEHSDDDSLDSDASFDDADDEDEDADEQQ